LWGYEAPERWGTLLEAQGDSLVKEQLPTMPGDYRQYYANVRDAILGKAPLAVTPESTLKVMRALELAIESSQKRCAVPWKPSS
jgi:predicted dehydrogenase